MNEIILEIKNLTKCYGNLLAVNNLSFTLKKGEIFGFIGPNGAGKSTTIRSIMNLIKKEGVVLFEGKKLQQDDIELKSKIGYLPSEIHLYEDMTVKEILDYHASFYPFDTTTKRRELVKRLKVDETKKIEDLSLGNLKKVGIVLAFMHEPSLLILDEPTSGLDPMMQQSFFELLKEEKEKGTTILYSTHVLNEVSKVCDRVGLIKDGVLLTIETVEEIKQKNLTFVTIESEDIQNIMRDLKMDINEIKKNTVKFKNAFSPDVLVKVLAKYQLDKLLIEEATLEDLLLHYYM